jgi:Ca2+-binding EF-hand superfamily protein
VINQIKDWITQQRITVEETFKCFDRDFDGVVNKIDLRASLLTLLRLKDEDILPTKLDRLFRLMDFYKTGAIQLSDF